METDNRQRPSQNRQIPGRPRNTSPQTQRNITERPRNHRPSGNGKRPKKGAKKHSQASNKSILLIVAITALIILIIFAAATMFSSSGSSTIFEGAQEESESQIIKPAAKTGFPISVPSGIDDVALCDSSLYVLSRNTVIHYVLSGTKSSELVFNYASPVIKTSSKYAIVYDRQGISFSVLSGSKIVYEGKNADGEYINSAYICDSGNFLIASRSSKGAGMLTYYNKSGDVLFKWLCANEYLVSCAVSENDNNIVCSAINAKSGEMYTTLYYFDIDKTDNNKEYTFNGAVCIDCFFVGNRNVVAVCQDKRIVVDFSKKKYDPNEKEYSSTILKQASDKGGNTAVVVKKDDSFDKTALAVYDSHNNISYECDLPDNVKDICLRSSKVYVLTENAIFKADRNVTKLKELTAINSSVVSGQRKIYYYTSGVLNRLY